MVRIASQRMQKLTFIYMHGHIMKMKMVKFFQASEMTLLYELLPPDFYIEF